MSMFLKQNIRFILNLLRYKLTGRRFPAHVAISVTNRCNLHCTYCFARYNSHEKADIPTERMIALIDELSDMGTRLINLTGGEPLVRNDIKQIIDYCTLKKGIKCSLSTNGLLLENKIDVLKNISSINISLDGNEKQHNRNRGKQDYQKVIKAIELAVKNHIPVSTCTVINKYNADCVDEIVKLAKEKDFLAIFHFPYGRLKLKENENLHPLSPKETKQVVQKIINYKKAGYPIYYSFKTHEYIRDWPFKQPSRLLLKKDQIKDKNFNIIPCLAGDLYCFIDASGYVYPCTVLCGQIKVKNFLKVGFRKAWDYLPKTRCKACVFFFQNELNLLLGLNISVWRNFIKNTRILH